MKKQRYTLTAPVAAVVIAAADTVGTVNVAFVFSREDVDRIDAEIPEVSPSTKVVGSLTLDYEVE